MLPSGTDYLTLMLLILMISLIIYTIILSIIQHRSMKDSVKPRIITKTVCEGGDYNEERDFRKGEYVGLIVGTCPKCGKKVLVHAIYMVGGIKEREYR